MERRSKLILSFLALIFTLGYIGVGYIVYKDNLDYAQEQNKKRLNEILWQQRALHRFVEETQKPVLYELKEEGKLYREFFDPKVLSFTYIARGIYKNLNDIRSEYNATEIYYKLATDNPRNALNQATEKELRILKRFRDGEKQNHSEIIHEDGHRYVYYAMPIAPNKDSCMRCHSTPEIAPKELVAHYGPQAGFNEKVGDIRAIISLKIPFESEYEEAMRHITTIMSLILFFLLSLYIAIFLFVRRIDAQQRIIKAHNIDLKSQAERDGLTGVLNRRSFDAMLKHYLDDPSLVLVLIDIDHFKVINDTFGHLSGDDVLQEAAQLLLSHIREQDKLFRVGGEEFVIISTEQTLEQVTRMTARLVKTFANHTFSVDHTVTISAGIASKHEGDSAASLYERVDKALYEAKKGGRNRYVITQ